MPSFQYRELLAKSELFDQQTATTGEESEDRTDQEFKRVYYMRVLSRLACDWQCRILLKSQADRVLARDSAWRAKRKCLISLEARVGFEPTNGGFADLSLRPLGYRAGVKKYSEISIHLSVVGRTVGDC